MLPVTSELVLLAIADLGERERTCKYSALAAQAACSYTSVYRAISRLTVEGYINARRDHEWGNSIYTFDLTKRGQEMVTALKLIRLGGMGDYLE